MSLARERLEFAPPPTPGMIRALILAVLAHGVLIGILTAGVAWKRDTALVTAEAELWSAIPQEAAAPAPLETSPAPLEVPPAPPEPPVPVEPAPKPQPAPEPAPEPAKPDPAIALAKEKAKQLKDKQDQEKQRQAKLEQEKLKKEKELAKTKANEQKAKDAKAKAEEKKLEAIRQQQIQRMAGLAGSSSGGSGAANSTSTALQSSAPSASYAGRVRARIKPNITYIETIVGNPTTEIEVRTSPDGTIISSKVVKASGTKSWDTAALNAIEKTGVLPRDENGRVPSSLIIVLSPRELIGN